MKLITVNSGSSGNCYFLQDDNGHYLMLDCGEKLKWKNVLWGCGFNILMVDAVLFTHWHRDHLGNVKNIHLSGIPSFSSGEVETFVRESHGEIVRGLREKALTKLPGNWQVAPWYVPHTGNDCENVPCYAYYIRSPSGYKLVYITDFLYSPVTFKTFKVNGILCACNHDDDIDLEENEQKYRHVVMGHSSLSTVNEMIKVNMTDDLRDIILCHLSAENATPDVMIQKVKDTVGDSVNVNIAQKGVILNL